MFQVLSTPNRFADLRSAGGRIPAGICRPLSREETPLSLYENHFLQQPHSFLLESGNFHPKTARFSFMGGSPRRLFKSRGSKIEEQNMLTGEFKHYQGDPLSALRSVLPPGNVDVEGLPPFTGGGVGFFSYDLVRLFERLPEGAADDLKIPDIYLGFFEEVIVIDHQDNLLWVIRWVDSGLSYEDVVADLKERLAWVSRPEPTLNNLGSNRSPDLLNKGKDEIRNSFTQKAFEAAVGKTKEYIEAGDIFQLNLSLRMEQKLNVHPWQIYKKLREINPSPFMGFLNFDEYQVVCGSPERLVKLKDGLLETRPIAGTRRKGKTAGDEDLMVRELMESSKERAEHIMLVDLERNDLGKVCEYGSVKVGELLTIEKYSHVMHLVSNVEGKLHPRYDQLSVLRALFPGGTITGCPKVRCMEIIEELEPVRRGLYTGSIGYLDYGGNMDLNIVIRSLLCKKTDKGYMGYLQAGAGIVADSIPQREYRESLNKAEAILKAIELAEKFY